MNGLKKGILIMSAIVLCAIFAYQIGYSDENSMTVRVLSAGKVNTMTERLLDVTDTLESVSLVFAGEALAYDAEAKTFYLPLSMSMEDYEAGSFKASLNGQKAEVFFYEDFTTQDKLTWMKENAKLPLVLVSDDSYVNLNLTLTGVSIIDFKGTSYLSEEGLPLFEMKVYNAESKTNWVTSCYTTSTLRGNTSLSYDKKSLRLKLKKQKKDGSFTKTNEKLLGMREDDDWILNGLYADDSRIKDKLANELWNEIGAKENPYNQTFGIEVKQVEVFMNDGYAGLYGLMYPIDRKQTGSAAVSAQLAKGNDVIERIYEKKYTGVWNSADYLGALPDVNMPNYRGGFYLKGDTVLQDEREWEPLYELAKCIEGDDAYFSERITSLVEQENVLLNWMFYQAIGGFDNYAKNYYFITKDTGGESLGYFIPWDLNISFGDVYADNQYYAAFDKTVVKDIIPWEPAQRMLDLDVDGSREMLVSMWKTYRNDVLSVENITARMDEMFTELQNSGAYERERLRWPNGRYTDDIENMKAFTRERLAFMDEYVENLVEE